MTAYCFARYGAESVMTIWNTNGAVICTRNVGEAYSNALELDEDSASLDDEAITWLELEATFLLELEEGFEELLDAGLLELEATFALLELEAGFTELLETALLELEEFTLLELEFASIKAIVVRIEKFDPVALRSA